MMKKNITIISICLGFISGPVFAAGYDESQQSTTPTTQDSSSLLSSNARLQQLLDSRKGNTPTRAQRQQLPIEPSKPVVLSSSVGSTESSASSAAPAVGSGQSQQKPTENTVSDQAFSSTVRNIMPMSPEQIKTLRYMFDESQKAAAVYPGGQPPRPTSSSIIVNLSPGATPPIIRLRSGFVTSLVFLDATGSPWPIAAYDLGDPNSFNVQWDRRGNTLLVQSQTTYKPGNLAVILKGSNTPVMITLLPGQQNVDYRVDLRVPQMGPNAKADVDGLPAVENPMLISFLDGVAPKGAHPVVVMGDGSQSQGWLYGGKLYLRTRETVLSPGWLSSMSSPDGTHVYELPKTPVVLASQQGTMIQLMIKGL